MDPLFRFYVGLHHPADAQHFDNAFISINAIRNRRSGFPVKRWIMDSGAFTEISRHGCYRHSVREYARDASRWRDLGQLEMVVSQDYMCEPFILDRTGLSVNEHQRLTIERYDELLAEDVGAPILPVLQGFAPDDYVRHLEAYGDRLKPSMRVGVGSVCKRNSKPIEVLTVLDGIKQRRPDLRLHGFGLKLTALANPQICALLHSSDSMAWSYAARKQGRNQNDWREAKAFEHRVRSIVARHPLGAFA